LRDKTHRFDRGEGKTVRFTIKPKKIIIICVVDFLGGAENIGLDRQKNCAVAFGAANCKFFFLNCFLIYKYAMVLLKISLFIFSPKKRLSSQF